MGAACSSEYDYEVEIQAWPDGLKALELIDQICAVAERARDQRLTKSEHVNKVNASLGKLKGLSGHWRSLKPGGLVAIRGSQVMHVATALTTLVAKLERTQERLQQIADRIFLLRSQRRVSDKLSLLLSEVEVSHNAFLSQFKACVEVSLKQRVDGGSQTEPMQAPAKRLSPGLEARPPPPPSPATSKSTTKAPHSPQHPQHPQQQQQQLQQQEPQQDQVLWVRRTYVNAAAAVAAETAAGTSQVMDSLHTGTLAWVGDVSGSGWSGVTREEWDKSDRASSPVNNGLYQVVQPTPSAHYSTPLSTVGVGGTGAAGRHPPSGPASTHPATPGSTRNTPHSQYVLVWSPQPSSGQHQAVLVPAGAVTPDLAAKLAAAGASSSAVCSAPPTVQLVLGGMPGSASVGGGGGGEYAGSGGSAVPAPATATRGAGGAVTPTRSTANHSISSTRFGSPARLSPDRRADTSTRTAPPTQPGTGVGSSRGMAPESPLLASLHKRLGLPHPVVPPPPSMRMRTPVKPMQAQAKLSQERHRTSSWDGLRDGTVGLMRSMPAAHPVEFSSVGSLSSYDSIRSDPYDLTQPLGTPSKASKPHRSSSRPSAEKAEMMAALPATPPPTILPDSTWRYAAPRSDMGAAAAAAWHPNTLQQQDGDKAATKPHGWLPGWQDVSEVLESERPAVISARAHVLGERGSGSGHPLPSVRDATAGRMRASELVTAAQHADIHAVAKLGRLLRFGGTGVGPDPTAAHGLLLHAAHAGVADACTWLAELYELGAGYGVRLADEHGHDHIMSSPATHRHAGTHPDEHPGNDPSDVDTDTIMSGGDLQGVPINYRPDYGRACAWYRRGMEAGSTQAGTGYGWLLEHNLGTDGGDTQAGQAYSWAALRGCPTATNNLGVLVAKGRAGPQDLRAGGRLILKAAHAGSVVGAHNLGVCLAHGGVPGLGEGNGDDHSDGHALQHRHSHRHRTSRHDAEYWLRRAAEAGHVRARAMLGQVLGARGAVAEAVHHLRRAGVQGEEPEACTALAQLLEQCAARLVKPGSGGGPLDPEVVAALSDLEALVPPTPGSSTGRRGSASQAAVCALGAGLSLAERVHVAAARWYSRAADAGEPCAQHWVGNALYDAGRTDAACTWWAAAASSGYPPSLLTLGHVAEGAFGGPVDLQLAAAYYRRALQAGLVGAEEPLQRVEHALDRHAALADAAATATATTTTRRDLSRGASHSASQPHSVHGHAHITSLLGRGGSSRGGSEGAGVKGGSSPPPPPFSWDPRDRLVLPLPLGLLGTSAVPR